MKLIEIQRHFFRLKGEKALYFCTEAESHNLNVTVVHYIRANSDYTLPDGWTDLATQTLRGADLLRIVIDGEGLGMAYRPASDIRKLDTQVPDSMGDDTHEALAKLKKAVGGNVTDFVCERLQWSRDEIEERLFAEQVDSVALAIYNMEARNQAMIIGDQTGIGKGRMAACLIRYGHVHGQKPVFITEKSNLFTDIYRDLKDIGCADLRPFIVNTDDKAKITEIAEDDSIRVVYKPEESAKNKQIFAAKRIPREYDYVLATYSQFNTPKRDADKISFLHSIVEGNTIILDEAHNAGGSVKKSDFFKKKDDNGDKEQKGEGSNTYKVFAKAVQTAKNVCFLSATFAKRPDNFPIFALRTCIREAELDNSELINSISKGGEALQEILSSELVAEGQMLRRERTYDGIKVNYIYLNRKGAEEFKVPDLEKEHRAISDVITGLMRDIIDFEKEYIRPIIEGMNEDLADEGEQADQTNKEMGVTRMPYFSKVFNIVNQVLFSIKADAVAEHAIRRLKEDKKVVIACASTFESLYSDLTADNDSARATEGDIVRTDYAEALLRGLQGTLKYTVRDSKFKTHVEYIAFDSLTPQAQNAYIEIETKIKNATTGITISPIDYIIRKIERAGYRVAEVTGRSTRIEFTNEQGTRGRIAPRKKIKANVAFAQFQNNQQDVLIINTSGSTGASAHATNKGTNLRREEVKPRVMIIAQCELNVSTEVQKRGRINRTGQFPEIPPSYDYLISAIPAEARMMMMLQKKLRSLDANTASNQKNSTSVIDTEDFINKYGDEVVMNYMKDNREFTEAINDPFFLYRDAPAGKKISTEDVARTVSGKVAVLSAEEQERFYQTVMENYLQKVTNLKARGEFDLEVEAMKLDAHFVREQALVPRTSGHSAFADAAYLGTYECNVLRKPYTKEMVLSLLSKAKADGDPKQAAATLADLFRQKLEADREKQLAQKEEQMAADIEAMTLSPRNKKLVEAGTRTWNEIEREIRQKYETQTDKIKAEIGNKQIKAGVIEFFYAGRGVLIDRDTRAICLGCEQNKKADNPFAPSNLTISFAVASDLRSTDYNLADDGHKELLKIKEATGLLDRYTDHDKRTLDDWEELTKKASANRELREIITGNILKGYKHGKEKSKLISFTMDNGEVRKGLLLPKDDPTKMNENGSVVAYKAYDALKCRDFLREMINDHSKEYYDSYEVSLSQGCKLIFVKQYSLHALFIKTSDNKAQSKQIASNAEWLQYGRGFHMRRGAFELSVEAYDLSKALINLDNLINSMHRVGLRVELTAAQAEQFIDDEIDNNQPIVKGEWKPLSIDRSKIPASKPRKADPTAANDDKARRLRLMKMKAKALMLYTFTQQQFKQVAGVDDNESRVIKMLKKRFPERIYANLIGEYVDTRDDEDLVMSDDDLAEDFEAWCLSDYSFFLEIRFPDYHDECVEFAHDNIGTEDGWDEDKNNNENLKHFKEWLDDRTGYYADGGELFEINWQDYDERGKLTPLYSVYDAWGDDFAFAKQWLQETLEADGLKIDRFWVNERGTTTYEFIAK